MPVCTAGSGEWGRVVLLGIDRVQRASVIGLLSRMTPVYVHRKLYPPVEHGVDESVTKLIDGK
jgi:hypothetical protein